LAEEPVAQEQDNIEGLKKALAESEEKAKTYLADAQRERADYQNLKKRTDLEKLELSARANAEMIRLLLPVVDDMQRAFNMVDPGFQDSTWIEGFRIIQKNLQDILRSHGCVEIECVGKAFDPSLHDAITYEDGAEGW
jgi:molecular chaperone GrpE